MKNDEQVTVTARKEASLAKKKGEKCKNYCPKLDGENRKQRTVGTLSTWARSMKRKAEK